MAILQNSDIGFAVGNGTSRRGFDVKKLKGKGVIVGCNLISLEYGPDYMVTLDVNSTTAARKLVDSGEPLDWIHLTRGIRKNVPGWKTQAWLSERGEWVKPLVKINNGFNNQTGLLAAAYLAEIKRVKDLYMIGIDFFRQIPGQPNELDGNNTYHAPNLHWSWNKLVRDNPQTKFFRVGPILDIDREYYDTKLEGFEFIESFEDMPF